ncbi:hypothetical protein D3C72_2270920 [compost metagenome]
MTGVVRKGRQAVTLEQIINQLLHTNMLPEALKLLHISAVLVQLIQHGGPLAKRHNIQLSAQRK